MITTDNEIFNKVMDTVLSADDRRLMLVTPKSPDGNKVASVGMIVFQPDSIILMKRTRAMVAAQLEAYDTAIMLSELGARLGVTVQEV
jgi:hypothetical protein